MTDDSRYLFVAIHRTVLDGIGPIFLQKRKEMHVFMSPELYLAKPMRPLQSGNFE